VFLLQHKCVSVTRGKQNDPHEAGRFCFARESLSDSSLVVDAGPVSTEVAVVIAELALIVAVERAWTRVGALVVTAAGVSADTQVEDLVEVAGLVDSPVEGSAEVGQLVVVEVAVALAEPDEPAVGAEAEPEAEQVCSRAAPVLSGAALDDLPVALA